VKAKAEAALPWAFSSFYASARPRRSTRGRDGCRPDPPASTALPEAATPENLVVAYEPVWAIGTGRTPSLDEIRTTHAKLRASLAGRMTGGAEVALLYGGSVKPANAADIMALADVDGALVGGASLDADGFWSIYTAGGGA
jgi:triosephosphate isomerase